MRVVSRLRSLTANYWQPVLAGLVAISFISSLLFFRLSTLVSGVTGPELANINAVHGLRKLLEDPTNLVYKLPLKLFDIFHLNGVLEYRAISGGFAIITLALVYYTLKAWYSGRVANIGLFLMATSSWFLGYARSATPAIIYPLMISAIFAYGTWTRKTNRTSLSRIVGALLAAALIYTPGLVWLVIFGLVWQRSAIKKQLPKLSAASLAGIALFALALLPLIYAVIKAPSLLQTLAGLPPGNVNDQSNFAGQLLGVIDQMVGSGEVNAGVGLLGVAILDVFTGVMLLLGLYSFFSRLKLDRSKMLALTFGVSVILVALGGMVSMSIMIPTTYLLASGGIAYLLEEWFIVFPRNPLARGIGLGLILVAVLLTSLYHLNRYYVAWPKAIDTRAAHAVRSFNRLVQ